MNCLHSRVFFWMLFSCIISFVSMSDAMAQPLKSDFVTVRAQLRGSFHQYPLPYARVINKTQMWGVLSDTSGIFTITAKLKDTIYVSSIGYFPVQFFVTDSLLKQIRIPIVWMNEKVYEMAEIDIQSLGSYQQFKFKVLNQKLPQNNIQDAIASIQRELKAIPKHQLKPEASISLGSPITGLYMMFSKEGKSLRKLAEAKERDKYLGLVNPKFNRNVVSDITGLKDDLLDEFMLYCRPDELFLIAASEYQIYERVIKDYERFMARERSAKRK